MRKLLLVSAVLFFSCQQDQMIVPSVVAAESSVAGQPRSVESSKPRKFLLNVSGDPVLVCSIVNQLVGSTIDWAAGVPDGVVCTEVLQVSTNPQGAYVLVYGR